MKHNNLKLGYIVLKTALKSKNKVFWLIVRVVINAMMLRPINCMISQKFFLMVNK
jgi:hypothetical protein